VTVKYALTDRSSLVSLHNASVAPALRKRCAHCGDKKPSIEFSRNVNSRDGLTSYCKGCLAVKRTVCRVVLDAVAIDPIVDSRRPRWVDRRPPNRVPVIRARQNWRKANA
jgi:hypothetical protein